MPPEFRNPRPYGAAQLTARPHLMVKVDNVGVFVLEGGVPVGMAMLLLSFPALVCVLMVLVMDMEVPVLKRLVQVLHFDGVVSRP